MANLNTLNFHGSFHNKVSIDRVESAAFTYGCKHFPGRACVVENKRVRYRVISSEKEKYVVFVAEELGVNERLLISKTARANLQLRSADKTKALTITILRRGFSAFRIVRIASHGSTRCSFVTIPSEVVSLSEDHLTSVG